MKNKRFVQGFQCTVLTDIGYYHILKVACNVSSIKYYYKVAYAVVANTRRTSHKTMSNISNSN